MEERESRPVITEDKTDATLCGITHMELHRDAADSCLVLRAFAGLSIVHERKMDRQESDRFMAEISKPRRFDFVVHEPGKELGT
jgi:hypothetical protein